MAGKTIMIEDYLTKLCNHLKITPIPEENDDHVFVFNFTEEITLFLQDLSPGCYVRSTICPCPDKNKEDLFIYLMKANLLGQGTNGAVISIDEEEKFLTLSLTLSYEVNYQEFKESLEDFVNYILFWREEIDKIQKAAEEKFY
jgi:hypothetical protein